MLAHVGKHAQNFSNNGKVTRYYQPGLLEVLEEQLTVEIATFFPELIYLIQGSPVKLGQYLS